jgi:hypothetical protein
VHQCHEEIVLSRWRGRALLEQLSTFSVQALVLPVKILTLVSKPLTLVE